MLNMGAKTLMHKGDQKVAAKESISDQKSRFTVMTHSHYSFSIATHNLTLMEFVFRGVGLRILPHLMKHVANVSRDLDKPAR